MIEFTEEEQKQIARLVDVLVEIAGMVMVSAHEVDPEYSESLVQVIGQALVKSIDRIRGGAPTVKAGSEGYHDHIVERVAAEPTARVLGASSPDGNTDDPKPSALRN